MMSKISLRVAGTAFAVIVATLLFSGAGWAWMSEGHEIVAFVAADNLTPEARARVAGILGVANKPQAIADAMAAASIRPDTEFRADPKTKPWHYIAMCLQDTPADMARRCPGGACVTAKIDEYAHRLKTGDYDTWGAAGDLAFLIHFVGDVHQPLHAGGNGDRGGTCQPVEVTPPEPNLHLAWDDAVVVELEQELSTQGPRATASALQPLYPKSVVASQPLSSQQMAWETHELGKSEVYEALKIPEKPCAPSACQAAPGGPVVMNQAYMEREGRVAGKQLAKAGYRLAALLNESFR